MTTDQPSGTPQLFQFTIRELLSGMTIICVASASVYWFDPGLAILAIVLLALFGIAGFCAARRRYTPAEIAIFFGLIIAVTVLLLPAFSSARVCYRWGACQNNMRSIALALQNYHDDYGSFPPAYLPDANGKPMHSWRVLILPYIEQQNLYNLYRFDEPWNGPNNSQLHSERVSYYECPSDSHATRTETSYLAVIGPQTIWPGATSTKMSDFKDGPANTILLVEAHNTGIHWMEPRDLDFATMPMTVNSSTGLSISSAHLPTGFANVVFADSKAQRIPNSTPSKSLRAALTISGKEKDKLPAVRLPR